MDITSVCCCRKCENVEVWDCEELRFGDRVAINGKSPRRKLFLHSLTAVLEEKNPSNLFAVPDRINMPVHVQLSPYCDLLKGGYSDSSF